MNKLPVLALFHIFANLTAFSQSPSYLVQYPDGQYLPKIESLVWGECMATKRTGKCQDYLKLFPDGAHVDAAQQIIADNEAQVEAFMATPGPPSSSPADPNKILPAKPTPTTGRGSAKASPNTAVYYEIVIVVGKKVEALSVLPGYRNLKLNTRKDGNQEARVRLQKGSYEMKVYEKGGVLKCNKPFTINGPRTISSPCQGR